MISRPALHAQILRAASILILAATGISCGDTMPTAPGRPNFAAAKATTVTIAPDTASIIATKTRQFVATVRDQNGLPMSGQTVTWASENTAIATVSSSGLVTAKSVLDSTRIKATSSTGKIGYARVRVIRAPVATVTVAPDTTIVVGSTATMRATLKDADGNTLTGRTVTWSASASSAAAINATTGVATALADDGGTPVTITATSEGIAGSASLRVRARATALAVAAASGIYGGTVSLTATLTSNGSPVAGRSVTFARVGEIVGSATTDAAGIATMPNVSITGFNAGSYSASAAPAGIAAVAAADAQYAGSSGTASLTIGKATQTITFPALAARTFGEAPFAVSATASSGLAVSFTASGSCSVSGTQVTILGAGTCTVTASQTGDVNYEAAAAVTQSFSIAPAAQTIAFEALPSRAFGEAPFTLSASATSSLPVSFVATGACSVSGSTVTLTASGNCSITASQSGNADWQPAAAVTQSFAIGKATATITLSSLNHVYDGTPKLVVATTSPAGLGTVAIRYAGSSAPQTSAGTYTVEATLTNADYEAAPATATLVIARAPQTITFDSIPDHTFGDGSFTIMASASSGSTVTFTSTGPCSRGGTTVTPVGAGTCTITAHQAGSLNYLPAPDVTRSFQILRANPTLEVSSASGSFGGSAQLSATLSHAGSPFVGDVTFSLNGTLIGSAHSNASGVATILAALTGIQAGDYPTGVTATFAGNTDFNAATSTGALSVGHGNASITLSNLGQSYDGTAHAVVVSTTPAGLSGLTVTYDGSTTPPTNAGSYAVVATLDNSNYSAAPATGTLLVAPATPTIDWPTPAAITYGTPLDGTQLNAVAKFAGSVVDGSFSYSPAAGTVVPATGSFTTLSTTFTPSSSNFASATRTTILFVHQATQTVTFDPVPGKTFGDAPFAVSAAASSGLPLTFSASGECSVTGNIVSITASGSCSITARQNGDANYTVAQVSQYFTIADAATTLVVDAVTGQFGGQADFRATLTRGSTALAGRTVSFSVNGAAVGSAVTDAAGVATVRASIAGLNAGSHVGAASASFAGDPDHLATSGTSTITVTPATATLTLGGLTSTYTGGSQWVSVSGSPYPLSGISVTYDGSSTLPVNAGSYTVVATLNNPNYSAAPVTGTFTIAKAQPTLSWTSPANITYGTPLSATQLNAAAAFNGQPVSGSFTYTPAAGAVLDGGTQTLGAAFTPSDANFNGGSVSTTLTVDRKWQGIQFTWLGNTRNFAPSTFDLEATATSGLAVTFSATGNCSVTGASSLTILADTGGTCTVTASQAGNANYVAATPQTQTFTILRTVTSVTITPDPIFVSNGSNVTVQAIVRGGSDNVVLTGRVVTWSSSNTSVVIAAGDGSSAGLIIGRSEGVAQVTASVGLQTHTVYVTVNPSGITHRWLGQVSSNWDDPANWWYDQSNSGHTPVPSRNIDKVFIPNLAGHAPQLASAATVGDLILQQRLTLSGHRMYVGGKLTVDSMGSVFQNVGDSLIVDGDAEFGGIVEQYGGVTVLRGNFRETGNGRRTSFTPNGGSVVFAGNRTQSINFSSPNESWFVDVEIANTVAPVTFTSPQGGMMMLRGQLTVHPLATLSGSNILIRGGAIPDVRGTYAVAATTLQTDATLTANRSLTSKLIIDGARLTLGGHRLNVSSLLVNPSQWGGASGPMLQSDADTLAITGDAEFGGIVEQYAGAILVGGNFVETGGQNIASFTPQGGTVVFNGTGPQSIRFSAPMQNWFTDVVIANVAAPVSFSTSTNGAIMVRGRLSVLPLATLTGPELWVRGGSMPEVAGTYSVVRTVVQTPITMERSARLPSKVVLEGAPLTLNGHTLTVGSLVVQPSPYWGPSGPRLINSSDSLIVEGDAEFGGGLEQYDGVIAIGGNFLQSSSTSGSETFAPQGGTVIFNGTRAQTITFKTPMSAWFTDLVIANTVAPVSFASSTNGAMMTRGHVRVLPGATLAGPELWIRGGTLPGIFGNYNVAMTTLQTPISMDRDVTIPGNFTIDGPRLTLNGHKFTVGGNLSVRGNAWGGPSGPHMINPSDTLVVNGNAEFGGSIEQYAGAIVLKGDFAQVGTNYWETFQPMGGTVILSGSAPQSVSFASAGASAFADLWIAPGSTASLATPAQIRGKLIAQGATLLGNGKRLDVRSLQVQGMVIDNTDFVVEGNMLGQFDDVQFTGYAPSAPYQMAILSYGSFAMSNITFSGTPDAGNAWIKADVWQWGGSGQLDLSVGVNGCAPGYSTGDATVTFTFTGCTESVAAR